jgi:hypothetical protein
VYDTWEQKLRWKNNKKIDFKEIGVRMWMEFVWLRIMSLGEVM